MFESLIVFVLSVLVLIAIQGGLGPDVSTGIERKLPRFSLRTLLILMTVVAILLGLLVYFSSKAKAPPLNQRGQPSGQSYTR